MILKFRKTRPLFLSLVCLAALLALSVSAAFGLAATVVSPANLNGWSFALESDPTTTVKGNFMPGPGTAPLGLGSAHLAVTDAGGAGQVVLKTTQFKGTPLDQITSITYSTYRLQRFCRCSFLPDGGGLRHH